MTTKFKEYTVDIVDDPSFNPRSADNLFNYDKVYYDEVEFQPTSKHGIKITKGGQPVTSAIICETSGRTGVHEKSFIIIGSDLLLCCCDTVYSFSLPELTFNWKKEFDPATCFGIYSFKEDLVVHGELKIRRIDVDGNTKWDFSARDIFVTRDGTHSIQVFDDQIKVTDWNGDEYVLDEHGQVK